MLTYVCVTDFLSTSQSILIYTSFIQSATTFSDNNVNTHTQSQFELSTDEAKVGLSQWLGNLNPFQLLRVKTKNKPFMSEVF